jgi:hypothetical protein
MDHSTCIPAGGAIEEDANRAACLGVALLAEVVSILSRLDRPSLVSASIALEEKDDYAARLDRPVLADHAPPSLQQRP